MDFYFTDRQYNVIEIASTGSSTEYKLTDDLEKSSIEANTRALTGTVRFDHKNILRAQEMCAVGNYILYKDEQQNDIFMTIMESHSNSTANTIQFTAEDAGVDLLNETVGDYKATKALKFADYFNTFTYDSGWALGINEISTLTRTLEWSGEESSYDRMQSVATQFGAELYFSFEINGTSVVKRQINVVKHRGESNNETLYVGKELNSITVDSDIYSLVTSIKATGGTPEGKDTPITLKGYKYTDPDGRFVLGADGIMRDTVAVQTWSRLRNNDNPNPDKSHLQQVKSYEAVTQASLCQSVLADLKKNNHPAVNYVLDIAYLPQVIAIGDTIHAADDDASLYVSARLLELSKSRSTNINTAVLGDYLIEHDTVSSALRDLADDVKNMPKSVQYYPWVRYADDASGAGFSAFPTDKAYMAIVFGKVSTPSDNPSDYAGKWIKILGPDGSDGLEGPKGDDGQTTYFHKAYANSADGKTDFSIADPSGKAYLGTCSDFTKADPTDPAKYLWQLVKGADGKDGKDGSDGLPGKDGVGIATTVVTYQTSTSGTTVPSGTWSTSVPAVTKGQYLWTRTIWTYTDKSSEVGYSVAYVAKDGNSGSDGVAGKDGVGIKSTTITYTVSASGTTKPTTGWETTIPSVTAGQYLWTKMVWAYTDGTSETGYSVAQAGKTGPQGPAGNDGIAGKDGIGVKSTAITYQLGSSGTTKPTGTWSSTVPTLTKGQYLWTKTTWTYSDSTTENGYSVSYIAKDGSSGSDGLPGKDGTGIKSTVIDYAVSSSGVTKPTTGWSASIPDVAAGQFMWTRTTWSYTDGTSEVGYSVAQAGKTGAKGDTGSPGKDGIAGKDGVGIKSTTVTYQASSNGTTAPTGAWTTNVPSTTKGQYLWTRTVWSYTDNTSETSYSVAYIAKDGNSGKDGIAGKDGVGIKSTTITYATSSSGTTTPVTGWVVNPPVVSPGQFMWTKTVWNYTDNSSETGYSVAQAGKTGATGPAGKDSHTHIAYANSADGKTGFSLADSNRDYMGMYWDYEEQASSDPAKYKWTKTKGADGTQGIPGPTGPNGKDSQFHQAWADSSDGKVGFSTTVSLGKKYLGTYTDYVAADSTNPTRYKWTELVGAIEIDGRNYLLSSRTFEFHYGINGSPTLTIEDYDSTTKMMHIIVPKGTGAVSGIYFKANDVLEAGTNWCLSADMKGVGTASRFWLETSTSVSKADWKLTENWVRYSTTGISAKENQSFVIYFDASKETVDVYIKLIKVEKSNKATGWSQAPEDIDKAINDAIDDTNKHVDDAINNLIPPPSSGISYPSNPKKGQQHWLTDANSKPKGLFQYDGSKWVAVPVNADTISANTLNGMTINGVTINGSTINSPNINVPFNNVPANPDEPEGSPFATFVSGTTKLTSNLNISGNITDGTNTTPQWVKTLVSPQGFSSIISTPDASKALSVVQVSLGSMFLSEWHSDVTANDGFVSSYFGAGDATTYEYVDALAENDNISNGTVRYTRKGSQVNVGFRFNLKNDTGWVALGKIRTGYTPASLPSVGINCPSVSHRGYSCVVYPNNYGWRLIPTPGQGVGTFQGSVSYTTYDYYPYNDAK